MILMKWMKISKTRNWTPKQKILILKIAVMAVISQLEAHRKIVRMK